MCFSNWAVCCSRCNSRRTVGIQRPAAQCRHVSAACASCSLQCHCGDTFIEFGVVISFKSEVIRVTGEGSPAVAQIPGWTNSSKEQRNGFSSHGGSFPCANVCSTLLVYAGLAFLSCLLPGRGGALSTGYSPWHMHGSSIYPNKGTCEPGITHRSQNIPGQQRCCAWEPLADPTPQVQP